MMLIPKPLAIVIVLASFLATGIAVAQPCNKSPVEVFREVSPSVVRIFSVTIDPFSLADRVQFGVGSGLVVDDRANIITNAHVVYGASEIMVSTNEDNMRKAEMVGIDPITDLAIIRLEDHRVQLPKARLATSEDFEVGQQVLAVGYPFGFGKTATQGIISASGRLIPLSPMSWLTRFIQTDAPINPGNSGGPLVNLCGEVLGINTLSLVGGQNFNFAIPASFVSELMPQLLEHGRVIRPWHGIHGRLIPPVLQFTLQMPPGLLIETIEPGSPAQKIGLRGGNFPVKVGVQEYLLGGDVILEVNGEPLRDMDAVVRMVKGFKVGDTVTVKYWREGQQLTSAVTLPERPILPGDVRRFRGPR